MGVESSGVKFKYLISKVQFRIRSQSKKFKLKVHSYISKMEIINKSDIGIWAWHETATMFDFFGYMDDAVSGGEALLHETARRLFVKLAWLALLSLYHI